GVGGRGRERGGWCRRGDTTVIASRLAAQGNGGGVAMSGGKGSRSQTVTQRVDIPDFLQPLARQQARLSGEALTSLRSMLGGDLTAGFTPDQLQAFDLARAFATGADGFLPLPQSTLMGAAQGVPLASLVDPTALSALTGTAAGQGIESFLPSLTLETLSRGARGGAIPTQVTDA